MLVCSSTESSAVFREGVQKFQQREIRDSLAAFETAAVLGHDADECAAYRWACNMLLGNFPAAWRDSDGIFERGAAGPLALWDGADFHGKRVVIRCLHGYGDAIQFLRFAPLVAKTASAVIVETHPEMVSLVSLMDGVDRVASWTDGLRLRDDEWDQQIEVTELPWAFRCDAKSIPQRIPYLRVGDAAREASARMLGNPERRRIGILWAASDWNPARSVPLAELAPILESREFAFYSFQRGRNREDLQNVGSRYTIHDTALHSPEISDTAADLSNMDLLITVDTMAAHLAGALGRPVWVMLPFEADWRWMMDRQDSPWYPTMRLFRQEKQDQWGPVIEKVANELRSV